MTDSELRELERRWRRTGSSEHQAEFLRAALRAGEVVPAGAFKVGAIVPIPGRGTYLMGDLKEGQVKEGMVILMPPGLGGSPLLTIQRFELASREDRTGAVALGVGDLAKSERDTWAAGLVGTVVLVLHRPV